VISSDTAKTLTRILTRVVDSGTGRKAAIPGFEVAGKTGTAQKLDPATRRYSRAPGVLSFVGFVPADDPRLAMLVMLDEPKNEKWGSEAAAPIFAAIGAEVLRYLDVPPRGAGRVQIMTAGESDDAASRVTTASAALPDVSSARETRSVMPDLHGRTLRQALTELAALGLDVELTGHGKVVAQRPAPGVPVEPGMTAMLTLAVRPGARAAR
jgi:cell division protein FtsI (penicillin-binding protein 3)